MTITLGGITFAAHEIQRISATKTCPMLTFALPFEDSDQAETITWGGNERRITIDGNSYEDTYTAAKTLYDQLNTLLTANEQTAITLSWGSGLITSVKVKVEKVEMYSDANAIPNGHFAFSISLVESK